MKTPNNLTSEQLESINELIKFFTPPASEDLSERMANLAGNIAAASIAMIFLPDLHEANKRGDKSDDFRIQQLGVDVAEAIIAIAKENIKDVTDSDWEELAEKTELSKEDFESIKALITSYE